MIEAVLEVNGMLSNIFKGIDQTMQPSSAGSDTVCIETEGPPLAEYVDEKLENLDAAKLMAENPWLWEASTHYTEKEAVQTKADPSPLATADVEGSEASRTPIGASNGMVTEEEEVDTSGTAEPTVSWYSVTVAVFTVIFIGVLWVAVVISTSRDFSDVVSKHREYILCQCESHSGLVTNQLLQDQISTVNRLSQLVPTGNCNVNFAGNQIGGSLPAVAMALMASSMPFTGTSGNLYVVWTGTGNVLSAEITDNATSPTARLYRHDSGLCWEAPYSSSTGYGTWVQTNTGPLGVSCSAVTSAGWYTAAGNLGSGTPQHTVGAVSSGYVGVTYMMRESTQNAVFGAELDGRTLRKRLNDGKPVKGEVYIVSSTDSTETLVTTTESSAQSQLQSSVMVNPSSVGGLTGSSASALQAAYSTFGLIWERSESVSLAERYGQVAFNCPSPMNAYVSTAATPEFQLLSDNPSVSLQRYNTTTTLQLLSVSAIQDDAYFASYEDKTGNLMVFGIIMGAILLTLIYLVYRTLDRREHNTHNKTLAWLELTVVLVTIVIIATAVDLLMVVSLEQRSAVEDFFVQIDAGANAVVGYLFEAARSMPLQATGTWQHTGNYTTNVSRLDSWMVPLLQGFQSSSNISNLRFATAANGLERSVNTTLEGTRIPSRQTANGCLDTYLVDGLTVDKSTSSDCYYDPRYRPWYEAGQFANSTYTWSDVYDSEWIAGVNRACSDGNCTDGWLGIWTSEFSLASMVGVLASLKEGFEGSLGVIEVSSGKLAASSSGSTLENCFSGTDPYINYGCNEIASDLVGSNSAGRKGRGARRSIGSSITSGIYLEWDQFPELSGLFFGMAVLDRAQFYSKYEDLFARTTVLLAVGAAIANSLFSYYIRRERQTEFSLTAIMKTTTEELHTKIEPATTTVLRDRMQIFAQALLRKRSSEQLLLDDEIQTFQTDLKLGRDAELHMVLLLCSKHVQVLLLPVFRAVETWWYMLLPYGALITLMALDLDDHREIAARKVILVFLAADAISALVFQWLLARKWEDPLPGPPLMVQPPPLPPCHYIERYS